MKHLTLFLAAIAVLFTAPAVAAGIPFQSIPAGKGTVPYYQLPDGTFLPAKADTNGIPVQGNNSGVPLGFQQVSVSSTAVGFTAPSGATWCQFTVETNAIRWRDDGTNPTASVGWPADASERWIYSGDLSAIKFIRQSGDATLDIACYK